MNRCRISVIALIVALVVSNVWLATRVLDAGITQKYMSISYETTAELLNQTLAVLSVAAMPGVSREEVIAAAKSKGDSTAPFEKDGYIWVGQLGLQFNEQGRFVMATTSSSRGNRCCPTQRSP